MQLIIFDTEFTAWEGSQQRDWSEPWEHRELIQLAAVKVDIDGQLNVEITQSFNELIKPVLNPRLSDYIVKLTGINQSILDDMGIDFGSALSSFHQFCEQGSIPCYAWGSDGNILIENCGLYGIAAPEFPLGLHNLNQMIKQKGFEEARLASGELASYLGFELKGQIHNALYDVRSVVLALQYWLANNQLSLADLKA